jgi:hypothetical protein
MLARVGGHVGGTEHFCRAGLTECLLAWCEVIAQHHSDFQIKSCICNQFVERVAAGQRINTPRIANDLDVFGGDVVNERSSSRG